MYFVHYLKYEKQLIQLLKWTKDDKQYVFDTKQLQKRFVICYVVRVIVLDYIFCKDNNKKRIAFENILEWNF